MLKKDYSDYQCPCCLTYGQWENVDQYRTKKVGMHMCKSCGLVQYPSKYKSKEEIKEYYRKNYRPGPQVNSLYTGERKLQYHAYFLAPLFKEWQDRGLVAPVIGEVGSAYGIFLNWMKQQFPNADIQGTELTESYRRVAYHEFGLKLGEELDKNKKYDMLATYHVLEHMLDPHKELEDYYTMLKDDGVLYLSVPIWFREANNSAMPGFDVEIHWAEDHINSWSEEHLEHMITRAGFKIHMKNDNIYGNTYILKKHLPNQAPCPEFKVDEYKEKIKKLWALHGYLQEADTVKAIETWPNCPTAWMSHYEYNRQKFHKSPEDLKAFFKKAKESCPNSADVLLLIGDIQTRYEQYSDALATFHEAMKRKPNNDNILMGISNCYRMMAHKSKDEKEKERLLRESINVLRFLMNVSTQSLAQAISWSYQDQAQLPIPKSIEVDPLIASA